MFYLLEVVDGVVMPTEEALALYCYVDWDWN